MSYSYRPRGRFGSSGPRFDVKKPVELDKEYEADIEEISRRGDGIVKVEGFVIFVPNTKQGEHVRFKVTSIRHRFAVGEIVDA